MEPEIVMKEIEVLEPRLVTKTIQVIENVPVRKQIETVEYINTIKEVQDVESQTFTRQMEVTEYTPVTKQVEVTEPVTLKQTVEYVQPVTVTETITKEIPQAVIVNEEITKTIGPASVVGRTSEVRTGEMRESGFVETFEEMKIVEQERVFEKTVDSKLVERELSSKYSQNPHRILHPHNETGEHSSNFQKEIRELEERLKYTHASKPNKHNDF